MGWANASWVFQQWDDSRSDDYAANRWDALQYLFLRPYGERLVWGRGAAPRVKPVGMWFRLLAVQSSENGVSVLAFSGLHLVVSF